MAAASACPFAKGSPLVGSTLKFVQNASQLSRDLYDEHGPFVVTSLLGKRTACFLGHEGAAVFSDNSRVLREGCAPGFVAAILPENVSTLDGKALVQQKQWLLRIATDAQRRLYAPRFSSTIADLLHQPEQGDKGARVELNTLLTQTSFHCLQAMLFTEKDDDSWKTFRQFFVAGQGAVPINLPFTPFGRAISKRPKLFEYYQRMIDEHRDPANKERFAGDALSILLETNPDPAFNDDDRLKNEIHHLFVAGVIVWAVVASTILELSKPANREHGKLLQDELEANRDAILASDGSVDLVQLFEAQLPVLKATIQETERVMPTIIGVFGKAAEDLEVGGRGGAACTIPKGMPVFWNAHAAHMDPDVYPEPDVFDPKRFYERHEGHDADEVKGYFIPRGSGDAATGHRCVGYKLAPLLARIMLAKLLLEFEFEVEKPDQGYQADAPMPFPKKGLKVRGFRARS